jgi:hypothetical protein
MANLREAVMKVIAVAVAAVAAVAVLALIRNPAVIIGESEEMSSAPPKQELCPKNCTCNHTDKFPAVDVQCGDQNLFSVPTITDNDILISLLNLSFNHLNNLTLRGYESAERLYLQYCKLTSIDEKAFYGFKNLKVVDLSSNGLTHIPPNLFTHNHLLDTLILQNNDLMDTDLNIPLLNGPDSLSSLDLQSCKLSNLSSVTFSSLSNLRILDISRNKLILLKSEYLHFLPKLEDIRIESNLLECGARFEDLLCWMQRALAASHNRTLECRHENETSETWPPGKRTSFCSGSHTTPSLTQVYKPDVTDTRTVNPNSSYPREIANSWWPYVVFGVLVVFFSCILAIILELRDIRTQCGETHIALRDFIGAVRNNQVGEEHEEREDENENETHSALRELRGGVRNRQEREEHEATQDDNENEIVDPDSLREDVPLTCE